MRKGLFLSVSLGLLLTVLALPAFAVAATPSVEFSLGDVTGAPGETIRIPLEIHGDAEYNSIGLALAYPDDEDSVIPEGLTFVRFEDYEDTLEKCYSVEEEYLGSFDEDNMAIVLALAEDTELDGKICDLVFKISDTAEIGTELKIDLFDVVKNNSYEVLSSVKEAWITIIQKSDIKVTVGVSGENVPSYTVVGRTVTVTHDRDCILVYTDVTGAYVEIDAVENADGSFGYIVPSGVSDVLLAVKGDIDMNGVVDIDDAILLFNHSMLPNRVFIDYPGNIDYVDDDVVDIDDAILLFNHSMLPNRVPLP